MTQRIINIGVADKGNGDPIRTAFTKVNENFTELYNLINPASLTELAQDYAASMFTNGTHAGITVEYDDAGNVINLTALGGTSSGTTPPENPTAGTLWYDTTDGRLYVFFDDHWVDASPDSVYTLPTASTSTLGGVKVDGSTITISNGIITAVDQNLDVLGDLTVSGQTISGTNSNSDIVLSPQGTGSVEVPRLKVGNAGNVLESQTTIEARITDYTLVSLVDYSTGHGDNLVIGTYGNINGVAAPWAVFQLAPRAPENIPVSVIDINDILGGEGILPSTVVDRGTDAYADYVIVDLDLTGLGQILPQPGAVFTLLRPLQKAGFDITTEMDTDIFLNSQGLGDVIVNTNVLPVATNVNNLGSPTRRWKEIYVGPGSIFVQDETLGIDLRLTAIDGNFVAAGSAGLQVGEFTLRDNRITIADLARDIEIGVSESTGSVIFNRPVRQTKGIVLEDNVAITFSDDSVQTTAWTGIVDSANVAGLADVATSGDYADLSNTPSNVSDFVNDLGFLTSSSSLSWSNISGAPTDISYFNNDAGYLTAANATADFGNIRISGNTIENTADNTDLIVQTLGTGHVEIDSNHFQVRTTTNSNPTFEVDASGQTTINVPAIDTLAGGLTITGSSTGQLLAPQNSSVMLHLTGNDSAPSRVYNDGADNYAAYIGRRYNGTQTTPTGVLNGDIISRVGATPYLSTGAWPTISTARIDFVASEQQTGTNRGNKIDFFTTPVGSTIISRDITVSSLGITFRDGSSQDTAAIPLTQKGTALGVATLGLDGKVPSSQLPAGAIVYQGAWNALTNTPTLANGVGTAGSQYSVSVGGTQNLGSGNVTFNPGDFVIYNGTQWERVPTGAFVTSVFGRIGDVVLTSSDITGALTYTPYNGATNPNGYVNASGAASAAPVQSVFGRTGSVVLASSDVTGALTAGSIANAKLANSTITIGSTAVSLGASAGSLAGLTSVASNLFSVGTLGYSDTGILTSLSSSTNGYNQLVIQNTNSGSQASANIIVSNDQSTATTNYGQFGMNSSTFTGSGAYNAPGAVYLTSVTTDLAIGTVGANSIRFFANNGATDAMTLSSAGVLTVANTIQGSVSGNAGSVTNGVYTTGSYSNPAWITSLAYSKLTGAPSIPAAQVNSDWNAVSGLAQILNKPTLFSGSYTDLTNKPTLFSGAYADLTGKPVLATVATSGSYTDLINKPSIPTVPTLVSAFTNDSGYITSASLTWTSITGKPTFATVATSGSYTDLINKPTLFSGAYADLTGKPTLFSGAYADLTGKPTLFSGSYTDLTNKPTFVSDFTSNTGLSTNVSATGSVTVTNTDRGSSQNIFKNITVAGQTTVSSTVNNDTVNFIAGNNMTITTNGKDITFTSATGTQPVIKTVSVQGDGSFTATGPNDSVVFAPGGRMSLNIVGNVISITDNAKSHKKHKVKRRDATFDTDIDALTPEDTLTFAEGPGIGITSDAVNQIITIRQKNKVLDAGTLSSGTLTVDMAVSDVVLVTVTGNITIAFTNITAGAEVQVLVKNTGTTNRTITTGVANGNMSNGDNTTVVGSTARTAIFKYISLGTTTTDLYCQAIAV